ncbi:MAG: hypothetical protein P8X58_14330 [Syntrophobacterales bacterium]
MSLLAGDVDGVSEALAGFRELSAGPGAAGGGVGFGAGVAILLAAGVGAGGA